MAQGIFRIKGIEGTLELGRRLGRSIEGPAVVELQGDLGAGKTHFVKGLAEGLDIRQEVTSPTFALANFYEGPRLSLHHLDGYRLEDTEEARMAGLEEILQEAAVAAVEWGEVLRPFYTYPLIQVEILVLGETEREVRIRYPEGWKGEMLR